MLRGHWSRLFSVWATSGDVDRQQRGDTSPLVIGYISATVPGVLFPGFTDNFRRFREHVYKALQVLSAVTKLCTGVRSTLCNDNQSRYTRSRAGDKGGAPRRTSGPPGGHHPHFPPSSPAHETTPQPRLTSPIHSSHAPPHNGLLTSVHAPGYPSPGAKNTRLRNSYRNHPDEFFTRFLLISPSSDRPQRPWESG